MIGFVIKSAHALQLSAAFLILSSTLTAAQPSTQVDTGKSETGNPAKAPQSENLPKSRQRSHFKGKLSQKPFGAVWDFGYVPVGYDMIYKTPLRNVGRDTLQILNVLSTCECTSSRVSRKIIAPDSSASLTITFNTEKFSGLQSRFVEILSTEPNTAERLLQFKAVVGGRPDEVAMLPSSLLLLPNQPGDSLVIKNYTRGDILFHAVFMDSGLFSLSAEFNYIPADGYTHLYLRAHDSAPAGEHYSTVTFEFETEPPVRVSIPIKLIRR